MVVNRDTWDAGDEVPLELVPGSWFMQVKPTWLSRVTFKLHLRGWNFHCRWLYTESGEAPCP